MSDYGAIKVRGADYLTDGVKIPPPCPPTMEIVHLEIYTCEEQIFHVCGQKDNWLQNYKREQAAKAAAASKGAGKGKKKGSASSAAGSSASAAAAAAPSPSASPASAASASSRSSAGSNGSMPDLSSGEGLRPFDDDFFFVVVFHVQTAPSYHLVMYFQRREVAKASGGVESLEEEHDPEAALEAQQSFDRLFERFIRGNAAWRNARLKLLPFLVDGGNWFVSKAVGNRPCIIGSRITTLYHCDPALNYMEVDIDVSGSRIGSGIFRSARKENTHTCKASSAMLRHWIPDWSVLTCVFIFCCCALFLVAQCGEGLRELSDIGSDVVDRRTGGG
jgi:hypothetical protein